MAELDADALVEAVARRVIELLRDAQPAAATAVPAAVLVDASRVAAELGASRDWVYAHADELGAIRLGACGDGRRPRLRFDLAVVADRLTARDTSERSQPAVLPAQTQVSARRRARSLGTSVDLLPIRGRSEAA